LLPKDKLDHERETNMAHMVEMSSKFVKLFHTIMGAVPSQWHIGPYWQTRIHEGTCKQEM
jgi:hypothetical protein